MGDSLIALFSLIALEIVLGIDNIIFISILSDKLPKNQRNKLRYWGIGLAMIMRLLLLLAISWILKLDKTLFHLFEIDFSGKGLILIFGGPTNALNPGLTSDNVGANDKAFAATFPYLASAW